MKRSIRRAAVGLAVAVAVTGGIAAPASAHILVVNPPGGETKVNWVGGGALPGQGQGLVPGGPTGSYLQSPAHAKGLNQACESIRSNGQAAADIFGPPTPAGCPHGT
jgi:hypothetical protein